MPDFPLRPFLAADTPALRDLFGQSIEELTAEDYDEDQRLAWMAAAEDGGAFAKRLAAMLTLVVQAGGDYLGFASLKDNSKIEMLYVHPHHAGEGVGTALVAALEKIATARGAETLSVDASDTALPFFERLGYQSRQRNSVPLDDQWLYNTTMTKDLKTPAWTRERLYLFDTTLRDGAQTTGVDFSLADKRRLIAVLDALGMDYIEGGYPGANAADTELFATAPALANARFTAFGMTKRAGRSVSNDPGLQAVLQSAADSICLVAKSWDYHVRVALGVSNEENLQSVAQSVRAIVAGNREALIDCEHFFDGYKGNRDYALAVARTAYDSGARWVVLCDTNGGTLPHEVARIVEDVAKHVPGANLGIHTHNDTENAVANTLVAVRAGCRQIQGTLNGLGERCGNANMTSIIPTLLLKSEFADRFDTGVTPERLRNLTHASRVLDEILNEAPDRHAPYVGESAFATKAGIHASALLKEPETYEHVPPESVGNERRILVSKQGGKSSLLAALERLGVTVDRDDARVQALLDEVKTREDAGYSYEAAEASFELLARRMLSDVPKYFSVDSFRVIVERKGAGDGEATVSQAVVSVSIAGEAEALVSTGEGNGPVNALDTALRRDLGRYQKHIEHVELVDYKVRILTKPGEGGTDAVTRVLVESHDASTGARWTTVGVSPNIIDASFEALLDSINYKLLIDGATPS